MKNQCNLDGDKSHYESPKNVKLSENIDTQKSLKNGFHKGGQWAKSPKKQSGRSAFLLIRHSNYSAILCHIVKNTLLQNAFSAILSTG